jgi:hypothetical protein
MVLAEKSALLALFDSGREFTAILLMSDWDLFGERTGDSLGI